MEKGKRGRVSRREPLWCLGFLLTAALLLQFAAALCRPAHTNYGSTWREYLQEPENSIDVLFLGSSYAYCDWNPGAMYDASGLTGYVMGGSEQTPTLTYWYLREALKTQKPAVVVMEGTSLLFQRYQNYTQVNVGYMPWGLNRVGATLQASEPEKRLGLFFDLYFYHDRWKELTAGDVKRALTPPKADLLKGFTAMGGAYEGEPFDRPVDQPEEVYQEHLAALGQIAGLCQEEGIDLIVTINPTYSRCGEALYEKMEADVGRAAPQARFYNWADSFEEIGLEGAGALSDGWHLNREGAGTFSAYTGRLLRELGYEPRPQSEENRAAWEETAAFWRE